MNKEEKKTKYFKAVQEYFDLLVEEGLFEKSFDPETNENYYSLSLKGQLEGLEQSKTHKNKYSHFWYHTR